MALHASRIQRPHHIHPRLRRSPSAPLHRGISLLVDHDVNDLRRYPLSDNPSKNWNDRISSVAVFQDRDEWQDRGPGGPPPEHFEGDQDWHRAPWHPGDRDSACAARPGDGSHWCDNFHAVHEARPVRQFGERPCEFNRNWGIDRGRLWVSDGCSAVFEYH